MAISQLKLEHFRNLAPVRLAVAEGVRVVALVGRNGAGKTSVLEAVSVLGGGRGLLGAEARVQLQLGRKQASVWTETNRLATVAVGFGGSGPRKVLVDGRAGGGEQMAEVLPIVWLAPRLDRLFYEGPGERRAWLDDMAAAVSPAHAEISARYTRHKRGRLKLLREGRHLHGGGSDWLDAEEMLMAEAGLQLLNGRQAYLERLNAVADGVRLQLEGGALEILQDDNPVAALAGKFGRSREIDARMERTHAGPDTLDVGGHFMAEDGAEIPLDRVSSGQHKRTLVRLVLAQARLVAARGLAPVVLIDELGAHLDAHARRAVLEDLTDLGCQVWVTDTELPPEVVEMDGVMVVPVVEGRVGVSAG